MGSIIMTFPFSGVTHFMDIQERDDDDEVK